MRSITTLLFVSALALATVASAQQRKSPHEEASVTVDGKTVTITYGRPYMKGRKIFGGLVPYGDVWRTGADEATTISSSADLML